VKIVQKEDYEKVIPLISQFGVIKDLFV